MFALFHEQSNMNPQITEVRSSLPCTDLTGKGDDIPRVKFWLGIVSTKTGSNLSFITVSEVILTVSGSFALLPPPPGPLLRAALIDYLMRIVHLLS